MSSTAVTDRNLLFGILAVQMDFITKGALIRAMNAWILDKATPLGEILVKDGALDTECRQLLEALVNKHVQQHSNDPEESLAELHSMESVRDELEKLGDSDLQASIANLPSTIEDPYMTHAAASQELPASPGLRFRILRRHAGGGLGVVYVAHDEELHREVALKEIRAEYADNPESRARFLFEGEVTGRLEHPGIVPVYGLGSYADGRPFYAMRFIRGQSLKDAVDELFNNRPDYNRGPWWLRWRALLPRLAVACEAVGYAHSKGVIHRDLKPHNIMIGPYGETLVVDWGLAKLIDRPEGIGRIEESVLSPLTAKEFAATQAGALMGTLPFMSPEQAAGRGELVGVLSDIYGLGAVLYYVLTGSPPFRGREPERMRQEIMAGRFVRPRNVNTEISPEVESICLKAMALEPTNRYPAALALAADLHAWLADMPVAAHQESTDRELGTAIQICILENGNVVFESEAIRVPVELGRQMEGEGGPYTLRYASDTARLIVADVREDTVSRQHILIEPLPDYRIRIANLRRTFPVLVEDIELRPRSSINLPLPYVLPLGRKLVRIQQYQIAVRKSSGSAGLLP